MVTIRNSRSPNQAGKANSGSGPNGGALTKTQWLSRPRTKFLMINGRIVAVRPSLGLPGEAPQEAIEPPAVPLSNGFGLPTRNQVRIGLALVSALLAGLLLMRAPSRAPGYAQHSELVKHVQLVTPRA